MIIYNTMSSNSFTKPLITGGLVVAGDKFIFEEPDMTKSLYFGAATALGVAAATQVSHMAGSLLPNLGKAGFIDSKTLEIRILEIGFGAGAAYGLNRYVLKNDFQYNQMMNKLALIAGADFVAEYITDYLENRPLSFFA